jgi:Phosphotransferase enzyme family
VDVAAAEAWIRTQVDPIGPIEIVRRRPWATVGRVPLPGGRVAWFKACAAIHGFEVRLTAELSHRWPDRVPEVLGHDEAHSWLLLADAGDPLGTWDHPPGPGRNPPEAWLELLPTYAELQRGEIQQAADHLAHGVPDLRVATLSERYDELLRIDLPLRQPEVERLRGFATVFSELCAELAASGPPETVQHDDLHMANVYRRDGHLRVLDWGDSSIAHPFASLVVPFRFLEEIDGLTPGDPWFEPLRDAYLEPWGRGLAGVADLALRVGAFSRAFAEARLRRWLPPDAIPEFDRDFTVVLRRALARTTH